MFEWQLGKISSINVADSLATLVGRFISDRKEWAYIICQ